MAKKLLGERQIGDKVYNSGQIISDEEFVASGLSATDVAAVQGAVAAPVDEKTPEAQTDIDAEVDAQASGSSEAKQSGEQSASGGNEAAASEHNGAGGASSDEAAKTGEGVEPETVEHVLTEQDLADNPEFATQGLKVGSTVRVPKEQVQA